MAHGFPAHDASKIGFELSLANQQSAHAVDEGRLFEAARHVLADSKFTSATISLAVVDDLTIHALNRQFLNHDWPTDVLSFALNASGGHLNGEIVLSADTAAKAAAESGWTPADEQLLYVIHGMLHLVGLDDQTETDAHKMRTAERYYLQECGADFPGGSQPAAANKLDLGNADPGSIDSGAGGTVAW